MEPREYNTVWIMISDFKISLVLYNIAMDLAILFFPICVVYNIIYDQLPCPEIYIHTIFPYWHNVSSHLLDYWFMDYQLINDNTLWSVLYPLETLVCRGGRVFTSAHEDGHMPSIWEDNEGNDYVVYQHTMEIT